MNEALERVARIIEGHGSATVPDNYDAAERLICASRGDNGKLKGNSFWITFQNRSWFLVTWAPVFYRVPDEVGPDSDLQGAVKASAHFGSAS